MPPVAAHFAKQLVKDASGGSLEDALHAAEMATAFLAGTEDFVEGPRAQKEKRKPSFTGR
ncbi:MAG: 2,3-dehydroadipyl-CoA hydratase, partial [Chloroflexota bacterium]